MSPVQEHEIFDAFASMVVEFQDPADIWPLMLLNLQAAVGFDGGYIGATWGNATEGRGAVVGHDEPFLKKNLGRYLAEYSPEEIALHTDCAQIHHDVWSRARQNELAVFKEVLDPAGLKHMIVRVSVSHGNVAGFSIERRYDEPFTRRELALVDLVAPFLHIVEILTLRTQDDGRLEEFARHHRLTAREEELVALAARGLQNAEIGLLLHISSNTVRNILARVFEKVGVSNRAELTYLTGQKKPHTGGRGTIVPPPSTHPDDGLRVFAARVEQATARLKSPKAPIDQLRQSSIVYTPPLTIAP